MNINQFAKQFAEDGYVAIPHFLNDIECHALNMELHAHFADLDTSVRGANHQTESGAYMQSFACDVIPWDPVAEDIGIFKQILGKESLRELSTKCLGPHYTEKSSLVMYSCKMGAGQSWHQDCPVNDEQKYNVNRLCYSSNVEKDDGAVVVVPGSHKLGRIPDGGHQESIPGERILCPKAGTLILLHGWCYHRVLPNISGNPRVSINYRCFPQGVDSSVTSIGVYRNGDAYFREARVKMR